MSTLQSIDPYRATLERLVADEARGYLPEANTCLLHLALLEVCDATTIVAWHADDFDLGTDQNVHRLEQAYAMLRWFDERIPEQGSIFTRSNPVGYLVAGAKPSKKLHDHILRRAGIKR